MSDLARLFRDQSLANKAFSGIAINTDLFYPLGNQQNTIKDVLTRVQAYTQDYWAGGVVVTRQLSEMDVGNLVLISREQNEGTAEIWRGEPSTQQTSEYDGIMAAFVQVCSRWKLQATDMPVLLGYLPEFSSNFHSILNSVPQTQDIIDRVAYLNLISLGLGALFDENTDSEVKWLNTAKSDLAGKTPLYHMRQGHMKNIIAVNNLVTRERGL